MPKSSATLNSPLVTPTSEFVSVPPVCAPLVVASKSAKVRS